MNGPPRRRAGGADPGPGMTGGQAGEPTLADVAAQYPDWDCARGISGLYHGVNQATGQRATGEDPLDLRDQIKAAEARHAWRTAL